MRRSWRLAAVTVTAFVASMTLSATAAPAQMADMCALNAAYMCADNPYEFHDYDTCYRHYYNMYCPTGEQGCTYHEYWGWTCS